MLTEYDKICQQVWSSAFNAEIGCSVMTSPEDGEKFADAALEKFKERFPNPSVEVCIHANIDDLVDNLNSLEDE